MSAAAKSRKQRGRSSITNVNPVGPTRRESESEKKTGVNRSVMAGGHRGDRRDMSPTYSGNTKHAARGNTPRKDVKTRKR